MNAIKKKNFEQDHHFDKFDNSNQAEKILNSQIFKQIQES